MANREISKGTTPNSPHVPLAVFFSPEDTRGSAHGSALMNLPHPLGVGEVEAFRPAALISPSVVNPPSIPSFCYNDDLHCERYERSSGP